MRKLSKNAIKLIKFVQGNPGKNLYEISLSLGVGYRRIYEAYKRTEELKLIRSTVELSSNRSVRKLFPEVGLEVFDVESFQTGKASELQALSDRYTREFFKKYDGLKYQITADQLKELKIVRSKHREDGW